MNKLLVFLILLFSKNVFSQPDTSRWLRALPISNYIFDINDSVKGVQVHVPEGSLIRIKEQQIGLLKGIFRDQMSDTLTIDAGMCKVITKSDCYFSINYKKNGPLPRENDLLYLLVDPPGIYRGKMVRLASHFIGLQTVYEKQLYDRYMIFTQWKKEDERAVFDSMITDIHFTGKYFLDNDPSMNKKIKGGRYNGQLVLNAVIACKEKDVTDFIDYMIVRPRLYAGHVWKIAEIFATWLTEGAPTVIK